MAALGAQTQPLSNQVYCEERYLDSIPMNGAVTIHQGTIVGNSGDSPPYATPHTGSSMRPRGVAVETVANTTAFGGGVDGDKFVKVALRGRFVFQLDTTPTSADHGKLVYAVDNASVSITDPGSGIPLGRICKTENLVARGPITVPVEVDVEVGG